MRAKIIRKSRGIEEYKRLNALHKIKETSVTFEEFITWYVESHQGDLEAHTSTFLYCAQPCIVRYNYYVRFNDFSNEFQALATLIGEDGAISVPLGVTNVKDSKSRIQEYYGNLSTTLKNKLYHFLHDDITFYHLLEPSDISFNEKLLEVSMSV